MGRAEAEAVLGNQGSRELAHAHGMRLRALQSAIVHGDMFANFRVSPNGP